MLHNNPNEQGYLDFVQGRTCKAWIKKSGGIYRGNLNYYNALQYILGWERAKMLGKAA